MYVARPIKNKDLPIHIIIIIILFAFQLVQPLLIFKIGIFFKKTKGWERVSTAEEKNMLKQKG